MKERGLIFNHKSKCPMTGDHTTTPNTHLKRAGVRQSNPGGGLQERCTGNQTRAFFHQWRHTEVFTWRQNYFPPCRCRYSFRPIPSHSKFSGTRLAEHRRFYSSADSSSFDARKLKIGNPCEYVRVLSHTSFCFVTRVRRLERKRQLWLLKVILHSKLEFSFPTCFWHVGPTSLLHVLQSFSTAYTQRPISKAHQSLKAKVSVIPEGCKQRAMYIFIHLFTCWGHMWSHFFLKLTFSEKHWKLPWRGSWGITNAD